MELSEKSNDKSRKSPRKNNWNYEMDGDYFVTICTENREHYFGEIIDNKMHYSHAGIIAYLLWMEMKHRTKNVLYRDFIVMPNHTHAIITLKNQHSENISPNNLPFLSDKALISNNSSSLPDKLNEISINKYNDNNIKKKLPSQGISYTQHRFQHQGKNSLSSIIGSYKSAVTKYCNLLQIPFKWQSRFHDHIIKDEIEYENISRYIRNNPLKWKKNK